MVFNTSSILSKLVKLSVFGVIFSFSLLSGELARQKRNMIPDNLDTFFLPSGKMLSISSIGYNRMLADLIWIKTLMYFGEEMNGYVRQTWLPTYISTVLTLDPMFEFAYEWAGAAMIYSGAVIDEDNVRRANHFYEEGLKRFPDNWKMAAGVGFNYAYELHPKDPKEKSKNRRKAIKFFLMAAKSSDAPTYVKALALTQMDREGFKQMAATFLKQSYAAARDENEKRLLEEKMKNILGERDMFLLKYNQDLLYNNYHKSLSYGDINLYIQLGPRPSTLNDSGTSENSTESENAGNINKTLKSKD
ncbi:MAG: hypothetical protein JXR95_03715 [Deltaproteobacteria bacterium]|nr:hypothetical protein [Deltaproteobacteria bacterium]